MKVESGAAAPPVVVLREVLRKPNTKARPSRLDCVDLLRGVVVVLMALDHVRDFFTGFLFAPENLTYTSGPLFFTRFVTHFCAPVFFLLAGAGGSLSLSQGKSVAQVSRFFWTRGLWLVVLDLTVVSYGWTFLCGFWFGGVLWAIGWSMIAMALLIRLKPPVLAALGTGIIFAHNLLDPIKPAMFGKFGWLWIILYGHGAFSIGGKSAFIVFWSFIPWVGVMAVGYAMGALLRGGNWRKPIFRIGAAVTIAFLILRIFHLYGNSQLSLQPWAGDAAGPWRLQATATLTIISFFDTLKYPASLQFLLMTLGPALMALAWLDVVNPKGGLTRVLLVFGRVPLFYYILHIYLIHAMAVWVAFALHQPTTWLIYGGPLTQPPPRGYGHDLLFIYAIWATVVALLYVPCKWFMNFKRQHPDWRWLSYI